MPRLTLADPPELPERLQMTVDEFLAFVETRPDEERWELIEGRPRSQASPSKPHQVIASNVSALLWVEMRCLDATWTPLLGVGTIVPASRDSLPQPDLMVLEHPLAADDFSNVTEDALVLFEIISRSNSQRDQAWRRRVYASIPNCRHYVTIHQNRAQSVRYDRDADWQGVKISGLDAVLGLPTIDAVLPMTDVYARTPVALRR